MKRIHVAAVLVMVLGQLAHAADWTLLVPKIEASVVAIMTKTGGCTGVVIDNDRDFVLTAAHCDGPEMYVDLAPAKIKAKDVKNDLMVVHVEGIDRPEIKLALVNPKIGDEVASYGYGYAMERPLFRVAHISDNQGRVDGQSGSEFMIIDSSFVPGQSGGPVVNTKGEMVMLVQMGNDIVGLGVGAETLKLKVGKYFAGGK